MNRNTMTLVSWISVAAAVCAWAGVIFFVIYVLHLKADRVAYLGSVDQSTAKQSAAARTHVFARDTTEERASLEKSTNVDVLSVVNLIESVGVAAGVKVQVSDVQNESTIPGKNGAPAFNAIGLGIQAQGSFSSLMRVAEMLESLPLPSSIEQLDIGRAQLGADPASDGTVPWQLNVRVKLLTTASVSP